VGDLPEAASAFVDDSVPASSSPRIDSYDLHGERLGARPDDETDRERRRTGGRVAETAIGPGSDPSWAKNMASAGGFRSRSPLR